MTDTEGSKKVYEADARRAEIIAQPEVYKERLVRSQTEYCTM